MPILLAICSASVSCIYNLVLSVSKLLATLQHPTPHRQSHFLRGVGVVYAMPDMDDPSRTLRKGKEALPPGQPPRQVHFETNGTTSSSSGGKHYPPPPQVTSAPTSPCLGKAHAQAPGKSQGQAAPPLPPVDNQPTSFPQVGAPPGQFGPGQWYTSADPRVSLNQPPHYQHQYQQLPSNGGYWPQPGVPLFANGAPAGTHFYPAAVAPHFAAFNNICHPDMAYYQNAGPPPSGVNFQPPVPDTTFGPIPHVYVPRFDGACASGPQQPAYNAMPVGQPGFVIAQQPAMMPQHMSAGQQPVYFGGQAPPGVMHAAPQQVMGGGIPVIRNRFTIDHMGDCRWYVTDEGWFYAVRLPD
ncbi:hypothetical protein LMH87_009707 [Akanthomyces muscarius]|uniref:Uncharacterized protein n=1 Tax=Akanthomyces muscarius TaxID=2231603 RepID=A0A9W8QCM7_AKAMU|nr:hypothetical protein LMH87_009707 [Akanthomyces muscarius]KAJ4153210.1 hypothetical protein LMH87_009707 [Akanthomyces muscarius]